MACVISTYAQKSYMPFRVDACLGNIIRKDDRGILVLFEPKYAIFPKLNIGLKCELNLIMLQFDNNDNIRDKGMGSCFVTADYYFINSTFRPFMGSGSGLYQIQTSLTNDNENTFTKNNFGAMFRIGFDVSNFRMAIVYNYTGKNMVNSNLGFYSIIIGGYIGGRKQK